MGQFVSDSFTDTDGVALSAHTPNVGGAWVRHSTSVAGSDVQISSNRARATGADIAVYTNAAQPPNADYDVQATFVTLSVPTSYADAICGRMDPTADTQYVIQYADPTIFNINKTVAGAGTTLASETFTPSGSIVTKLEMRGTSLKAYRDGVLRLSTTDVSITAAGRAGLRKFWDTTSSTGIHWEDFAAFSSEQGFRPRRMPLGV